MRIAVFGLGYVGVTSAACLAAEGHDVVGVDVDPVKLDEVRNGRSPVAERYLADLLGDAVTAGRLTVTGSAARAVADAAVSLVCVGTPSASDGCPDTAALRRVTADIGAGLAGRDPDTPRHTVVFRSTMLPGTCEGMLLPELELASGLRAGVDVGVAVHPEFLREGTSVADFLDPPKTVVGELDAASGTAVLALHAARTAPVFRVPLEVAEMVKYADNAFHALKISFVNEVGSLARALGVDGDEVLDIVRADRKLNVSTAYLRPGFAFGGSCLPKDLRALMTSLHCADVHAPVLENVLASNDEHLRRAFELVVGTGATTVGVFGLAFKPGTDDLRESPTVALCARLVDKGIALRIHDPVVADAALIGANRAYVDTHLPGLDGMLVRSAPEVLAGAGAVVVGALGDAVVRALQDGPDIPLVDLVGLPAPMRRARAGGYVGLAW